MAEKEKETYRTTQSLIEYVLVIALVAIVVAVALISLGESKEDYTPRADETADIEETE